MTKILVLEDDLVAQLLEQLPDSGHQAISALRTSLLNANRAGTTGAQTQSIPGNSSPAPSSRTRIAVGHIPSASSSQSSQPTPQAFFAPRQTRPTRLGRSQSMPPLGDPMVLGKL
ncbi:hypothetical protein DFH06DRAFT_1345555 [Mycena polygramma]|nr:hypothetical protein DFH06DRAFT_1345555 [Mycena polygramma]